MLAEVDAGVGLEVADQHAADADADRQPETIGSRGASAPATRSRASEPNDVTERRGRGPAAAVSVTNLPAPAEVVVIQTGASSAAVQPVVANT